ncbi:hypothetical protein Anacy_0460 [Anabaena cylindrica PCC 7122]|uniref:Uncharacterized protein n=1 Tax=Anabaena cylindrica (strain ATCC 27899 / PCC 7122) TaxID=272123 RepID=K9ZBE8_ANACC|nr:hypothetical protein Anacy_0460 [Anabaena cylindrica PCC 7122]
MERLYILFRRHSTSRYSEVEEPHPQPLPASDEGATMYLI